MTQGRAVNHSKHAACWPAKNTACHCVEILWWTVLPSWTDQGERRGAGWGCRTLPHQPAPPGTQVPLELAGRAGSPFQPDWASTCPTQTSQWRSASIKPLQHSPSLPHLAFFPFYSFPWCTYTAVFFNSLSICFLLVLLHLILYPSQLTYKINTSKSSTITQAKAGWPYEMCLLGFKANYPIQG